MNARMAMKIVSAIISIIGIWILLKSTILGLESANEYLRSVGGSMDSMKFQVIEESYMASYRILGTVLLSLGGLLCILDKK